MKKLLSLLLLLCAGPLAAQQTVPPRFQGADVQRFMIRLTGEAEKIVLEKGIPAAELTPRVAVGFRVDTTGAVSEWRFLDNTSEGRDRRELKPATDKTRAVLTEALSRLEPWSPATCEGRPVEYTWRLTMRLPVEKIAAAQDPDPLLFLGEDPDKSFYEWARVRIRYDQRFEGRGEGVVHVRFFVEPDGKITIDQVLRSPDEKLAREVVRIIRNSRGKWTPRKVDGVAQRTAYVLRINFV